MYIYMTCKAGTYISNRISYIAPKVWKPANYGERIENFATRRERQCTVGAERGACSTVLHIPSLEKRN
jgi:hypothetical protein